jgi:plastocyanin
MSPTARRAAALAAILAAGALASAAPTGAAAKHQARGRTRTVGVDSDYYDPDRLTIHVGDRVKWVWHASGFALHDVYVDSGPTRFHSPTQASGEFTEKFAKAGTYRLYCSQHEEDMTMTLIVKKAAK